MIDNTTQATNALAIAQYAQNQAASGQAASSGLFSAALETAMAQGTAKSAAASSKDSGSSFSLADFAPLLLSGISQGSESGMLMLLMAAMAAGGGTDGEGLLNGLGSALGGGDSLLSSMLSGGSSLFGGTENSGGLGGAFGGSATSQAAMVAAQSLFKAYQNVSGNPGALGSADGGGAVGSNKAPGRAVTAELTSGAGKRSPAAYRSVIDQFDVENNPRYAVNRKGTGDTYCNVFVWDVTSAMGAEIPHRIDRDTGAPAASGGDNIQSMNANRMTDWLNNYGPRYGWYEVNAEQAQALANRGSPAVAVWKNKGGGHGHVQVVSPSEDGAYDPSRGVAIAQAGRLLRNYTYITNIYSSRLKDVQYFAHR